MESLINNITSNPLYLVIAIIIVVAVIISIVKKLFKLMILTIAVLIIYAGYMSYTGQKIPTTKEEFFKQGSKQIEKIKKAGEKQLDNMIKEKVNGSSGIKTRE